MREPSPRGTYLAIAEALRRKIESNEAPDELPSEATLISSFGVSRNTIRRALKLLKSEQVVESIPGVGWRIARDENRRTTLAQRMIELLSQEFLRPGDVFPSEAQLCERFGASRTAVRSALAQLEGAGLLDTVHGKGRTVRALPASS